MAGTRLMYGANSFEEEGLVGKTVGEIREQYAEALNLGDNEPKAVVFGDEVNDDYVLKEGENLEFIKPGGEKG